MGMTKKKLSEYRDCKAYLGELEARLVRNEEEIGRLEERISLAAPAGQSDVVTGGAGGKRRYHIEGIPCARYSRDKTGLELQILTYERTRDMLEAQRAEMVALMEEVEKFIAGIEDISIRRIVSLRFSDGLKWNQVADRMGGDNTESSVTMAYRRYMDSINSDSKPL